MKGENGFAADDVLRLNRGARPPLFSIAENSDVADKSGNPSGNLHLLCASLINERCISNPCT